VLDLELLLVAEVGEDEDGPGVLGRGRQGQGQHGQRDEEGTQHRRVSSGRGEDKALPYAREEVLRCSTWSCREARWSRPRPPSRRTWASRAAASPRWAGA